jgi:predicted DNA-binding ArsR family transcriptional regulator
MNQYYWEFDDPFMQNYLAHHGVKGQSWGKRQWQNPDGSLTPAGRIHYGVGKAREAAGKVVSKTKEVLSYDVGKGISNKIRDLKYGKTYDSDMIENYKSKLGKTQYTNLDGTLNEKGKQLASTFISKEVDNNNKYYDKKIEKYKKAAEAYKDDPDVAKKFLQMAKSAEESRNRTNENMKNLSIDQMLQIQMQRNQKAAKMAAGAASVVGAGALVGAAVNEDFGNKMNDMFNSFGPDTLMNTVNDVAQTDIGKKAFQAVDSSIRMYADARAYVVGTALDQSMNRLNQMGIPQKAGNMVGTAAAQAGRSLAESGAAEEYAKVGSKFLTTFMDESGTSMDRFTTSANNVMDAADRAGRMVNNGSEAVTAVSKILNSDINSVGSTAVRNTDLVDKAVNKAISNTGRTASDSTTQYVESLANAGMSAYQIAKQTGLTEELIRTIL